jgi:hypothetical protein
LALFTLSNKTAIRTSKNIKSRVAQKGQGQQVPVVKKQQKREKKKREELKATNPLTQNRSIEARS